MKPIDYILRNLSHLNMTVLKQIIADAGETVSEEIYDYLKETPLNTNTALLKQFGLDIEVSESEPEEPTWVLWHEITGAKGISTYGGTEYILAGDIFPPKENMFANNSKLKFDIKDSASGVVTVQHTFDPDTGEFSGFNFEPQRFAGSDSPWMIYSWSKGADFKLNYNGPDAPETLNATIYKEA